MRNRKIHARNRLGLTGSVLFCLEIRLDGLADDIRHGFSLLSRYFVDLMPHLGGKAQRYVRSSTLFVHTHHLDGYHTIVQCTSQEQTSPLLPWCVPPAKPRYNSGRRTTAPHRPPHRAASATGRAVRWPDVAAPAPAAVCPARTDKPQSRNRRNLAFDRAAAGPTLEASQSRARSLLPSPTPLSSSPSPLRAQKETYCSQEGEKGACRNRRGRTRGTRN